MKITVRIVVRNSIGGKMSDLISRNDAIEAIDFEKVYMTAYLGYVNEGNPLKQYNKGLDDAIKAINKLPSAEPERKTGKWLPVSERLPWTDTDVLVTVFDDSGDTPWSYTSRGWLTPDGQYWVVDNEICYGVVAWMPLPEPWRDEK